MPFAMGTTLVEGLFYHFQSDLSTTQAVIFGFIRKKSPRVATEGFGCKSGEVYVLIPRGSCMHPSGVYDKIQRGVRLNLEGWP